MKTKKFKINSWDKTPRNEINIKVEVFLALSDKRYLDLLSSNAKDDVIRSMSFDQYKYFLKKNTMYKKEKGQYYWSRDSVAELSQRKQVELARKPKFVPIRTDPKSALKQALRLLNTAFTLNKNVKKNAYTTTEQDYCGRCGCSKETAESRYYDCSASDYDKTYYFESTSVDYSLRDSEYAEKTKIIKKVINLIKNNLLPIKYGKNDEVIYFEYLGKQCSFHDPKNQIKHIKAYNGVWSEKPNKKIPFTFLTTS